MDADVLYDARMMDALVAGRARRSPPDRSRLRARRRTGQGLREGRRAGRVLASASPPDLAYDTIGESVGFFRFRETTARRFAAIVARAIDDGHADRPHEDAIRELLLDGVDGLDVADVTGLPWIEIDFPDDVVRARDVVLPRIRDYELAAHGPRR